LDDYPMCANIDKINCGSLTGARPRACGWRLDPEVDCNCIEFDIRTCTKSGGGTGHQTCGVTGTSTHNVWGVVTSWNTCT